MGEISPEQFTIAHLQKRQGLMASRYEEEIADLSLQLQVALQEVETWKGHARTMADQVLERENELKELKELTGDSSEAQDEEAFEGVLEHPSDDKETEV